MTPIVRAISQLDDRVLLGVVIQSVLWSVLCFALLHVAAIWAVHGLLDLHGWIAWVVDALGSVAASLLALWLFVPVAAAIGTLYFDRIAAAVERRWYPALPPPEGAPLSVQVWDGVILGLRILGLNIVALLLALAIPGIGLLLAWAIAAYALGRGLFVAVAMRRMPRPAAEALYRACRWSVLAQGGVMAVAAYVPLLNLLLPVVGTAAMVHALDMALARVGPPPGALRV
ncbi:MAG: EI24 domain-containing protein [Rhodospirillales bacterium]|nr:EI24 domain-containing protein [Rhodospirillales bacterium]MBN8900269.1 EI24 domain-containing protein [Rhodospirillales bacterium]